MEWKKLKTLIILLLLVLNLFLLFLVGSRERLRNLAQEELQSSTITYLEKNGLALDEELVPWDRSCDPKMTERNHDDEGTLASTLLGEEIQKTNSGVAMEYTADSGSVRFYPDGEFMIALKQGEEVSHPERHAVQYLEKLGFNVLAVETNTEGAETTVRLFETVEDFPVFSCQIKVTYRDGRLASVHGWRLLGAAQSDSTQQEPLDPSTLLMRFWAAVRKDGSKCSQITAITLGYQYSTASLSAQSSLTPVWKIETNGGVFYFNCISGTLEANTP